MSTHPKISHYIIILALFCGRERKKGRSHYFSPAIYGHPPNVRKSVFVFSSFFGHRMLLLLLLLLLPSKCVTSWNPSVPPFSFSFFVFLLLHSFVRPRFWQQEEGGGAAWRGKTKETENERKAEQRLHRHLFSMPKSDNGTLCCNSL